MAAARAPIPALRISASADAAPVKAQASHPLPHRFQVSANFQSLCKGPELATTRRATRFGQQVLGLISPTTRQTIGILLPNSLYGDRIHQTDFR